MIFVEFEVLTYIKQQVSEVDYEALGLPAPEEDIEYSWQTRFFNKDVFEKDIFDVYAEKEDQTIIRLFDDRTIIVKGTVEEILAKLK